MTVEAALSAEHHAVELTANTLDWLLNEGTLTHRGLRGVLTAARTQLTAAQVLVAPEEEP